VNTVHFSTFDLNLLRVFDAMMEERSVIRAGRRIGLSPSAVSHALNRLRHALGDELFVRDAERMRPTPRASEIASEVHGALARLGLVLYPPAFDPANSTRIFTIAAHDYATAILLPPLLRRIGETAPHVDVRILPANALDIADSLDAGRVDFAIGLFAELHARFGRMHLFTEDVVYVMRANHPRGNTLLSVADLAEIPHVVISLAGGDEEALVNGFIVERGMRRRARIDNLECVNQVLAERGLRLRIGATVPHILAVPMIVGHSDMIAILPRRLAEQLAGVYGLRIVELPCPQEARPIQLVWHTRSGADPANMWLRNIFASTAGALS
jgi:DNA-binding transcriptional LysR family regulator